MIVICSVLLHEQSDQKMEVAENLPGDAVAREHFRRETLFLSE
jgi:hypothetical protein